VALPRCLSSARGPHLHRWLRADRGGRRSSACSTCTARTAARSRIVEQALFPATTTDADRTRVFAWYNVLLDTGIRDRGLLAAAAHAAGKGGGPADARCDAHLAGASFCLLYVAAAMLIARLPQRTPGAASVGPGTSSSPASRPIVTKISLLFCSMPSAAASSARRSSAYSSPSVSSVSAAQVALLFACGRIAVGLSPPRRRLAREAHRPREHDDLHARALEPAAVHDRRLRQLRARRFLFLLREALNEMDVPTAAVLRDGVVRPRSASRPAGITSLVRSTGWAAAPVLAGLMMQAGGLGLPLVVAGGTKITYDLLLWREFRRVKPPEEIAPG
jgi:hypothetical protein